jgi:hypothetical protein
MHIRNAGSSGSIAEDMRINRELPSALIGTRNQSVAAGAMQSTTRDDIL